MLMIINKFPNDYCSLVAMHCNSCVKETFVRTFHGIIPIFCGVLVDQPGNVVVI